MDPSRITMPPQAVATILIADEAALAAFARRFVAALPPRAFVTLSGDLGAGKTTFVKAVAAAAGIDPAEVVSPTFGLIHEHALPADGAERADRLVHAGEAWVFVEWPERIAAALPAERIDLVIAIDSPTARTLTLAGHGAAAAALVAALAAG
jgi:tRNA A37 threonylcarbamoyladenosine biosynthesis protein TsaE